MTAPWHGIVLQDADGYVGTDPDQCVNEDAHDQVGDLLQAVRLAHQVADALAGTDALGEHERDDRDAGREAQPRHDGRHGERHDDAPDQLPPLHTETAGGLDHPAVHVAHAVERVEVHGEQRGQPDEQHVGGLADPEPNDEEEDQRGVGNRPEHLHRRVEKLLAEAVQAHDDAEDETDARPEGKAQEGATDGDADVADEILMAEQLHEGVPSCARCRDRRRRNGIADGEDPPGYEDRDRQAEADGQRAPPGPLFAVPDGQVHQSARRRDSSDRTRGQSGRPRGIGLPAVGFAGHLHRHDVRLEFFATTLL
jgi:hypothetical protein